ncbi:MAG: polyprenyl diphosphate synthase [Simkaniaceae bacterium]|nr:polyprenyl diphosphate synthase [Simkaniaceae bacterium]
MKVITIPEHIAIIMDGNRRWAKKRGLSVEMGHWEGAEAISRIVSSAKKIGVRVLTLYSFSTENWLRSSDEVDALMKVMLVTIRSKRDELIDQGVRLRVIGDLSRFPEEVREEFMTVIDSTSGGKNLDLVLALNYGGRDELRRAAVKLADSIIARKVDRNNVSEADFAACLDTAGLKDPELLIRTSGEFRVSNFLLWQISYAELVVTDVLWPDFTQDDLEGAIEEYQKRSRRHGE